MYLSLTFTLRKYNNVPELTEVRVNPCKEVSIKNIRDLRKLTEYTAFEYFHDER